MICLRLEAAWIKNLGLAECLSFNKPDYAKGIKIDQGKG
jgi:hypothetical protein